VRATVPLVHDRFESGSDAVAASVPTRLALAVVAAVSLGFAVEANFGQFSPQAIGALAIALVAALGALLARGTMTHRLANVLLGIALASQFTLLLVHIPCATWPASAGRELLIFRGGVALACLLAALATFAPLAIRRCTGPLLLGIHLLLGLLVLRTVPQPGVDVCTFQRESCDALLHRHDPYTINFADPYGPASGFYGATLVKDGRTTFGYPYPPLPLLLAVPGHLLGDFRLSLLLATTLTGAILMRTRPSSPLSASAAALLLFTPRGFFVLEAGWIEPFVVLLMAGVVFLACRMRTLEGREATSSRRRAPQDDRLSSDDDHPPLPVLRERLGVFFWWGRHSCLSWAFLPIRRKCGCAAWQTRVSAPPIHPHPRPLPEYDSTELAEVRERKKSFRQVRGWLPLAIVIGLFLASKQYLVLAAPLLLLLPAFQARSIAWKAWSAAFICGVLMTIPMALCNLPAFVNSVVTLQFHQPFRPDSLSFLVPISRTLGATPPTWISFAVAIAVMTIALRKAPRTPSGFVLATGAVFLAFFAFNKQAFCNYYHFVIGAFCCALAAAELPRRSA
jgi:hypothetical protein